LRVLQNRERTGPEKGKGEGKRAVGEKEGDGQDLLKEREGG
jgi:hypothetical protein